MKFNSSSRRTAARSALVRCVCGVIAMAAGGLAFAAAEVEMPRGKLKEDAFFGKTETFRDLVRIRVPVSPEDAASGRVTLKVTSQGCADIGVCYTPLEQLVRVNLPRSRR